MNDSTLDSSVIDRSNILNNQFAVAEIEKKTNIKGFLFEGERRLTTQQVADYFEVDIRTIERYVNKYGDELKSNGYELLMGDRLRDLKSRPDINVGTLKNYRTSQLGVFTIKAFLDIAMLLAESQKAKELRKEMLNVVVDVISRRAGGDTKYINQRDDTYIIAAYYNDGYHKSFIDALTKYVDADKAKYPNYTDRIYREIFCENTSEYKRVLDLAKGDKARETMYSEVITAISSFEAGVASYIKDESLKLGRKLTREEVDGIFDNIVSQPTIRPMVDMARMKMASLDMALRRVQHAGIANYALPINQADFERFLGEKSRELSERINENRDVLKRLKDK